MGSKSPKMEVTQYYMSIHYGLCIGPVDEISRIQIDKKDAWTGSVTNSVDIAINKSELFGGLKKEGGAQGTATYLSGDSLQSFPEILAAKLGLTKDTCPAYRGLSSIFFHNGQALGYDNGELPQTPLGEVIRMFGGGGAGNGGFYWRANTPYLPGTWVTVKRRPRGLDTATAMIGDDANGAHIIYECLTNTDWGMGGSPQAINIQSFLDSAQTLFNEGLGMSLLWTQQETIENFITNVINHIEGVLFVNPRDGLITLKLIRADYNEADLFVINPDNAKLSNFARKLWGETTNEIVVSWTNPESEETETVTIQDLGNIAMQGGVVSSPKDYKGIRNADTAMMVAARDLRVASSPLASCEAIVNRDAWETVPGSVVKVTWPEHGMEEVVMRVGNVDYGKTSDSAIRVQLVEDVFSLPQAHYVTPPSSEWIDPSETPAPMVWSLAMTMPYFWVRNLADDTTTGSYPQVVSAVLGAQPGSDTKEFLLAYEAANPAGEIEWQAGAQLAITSRGYIDNALPFASTSTVAINDLTQGLGVTVGSFGVLGTNDADMELVVVTSMNGNALSINRGVLDTTPKEWAAGTPIWFVDSESIIADAEIRVGGQDVEYRLLTITSKGMLPVSDAPTLEATLTERPWLPSRPANVKINGIANGLVDAVEAAAITVTWSNRNREMEDAVVLRWNEATVNPESGQTTTISVLDVSGNVLTTHDGIAGTSFDLPKASFGGKSVGVVRVTSKREGLESLQGHEIKVQVAEGGYGLAYGMNYGG